MVRLVVEDIGRQEKGSNYSLDRILGDWYVLRMPRKLRVEYPGAIYHVMSRANGKGNIFETEVDRQDFIMKGSGLGTW